eukprot:s3681_g3.t1
MSNPPSEISKRAQSDWSLDPSEASHLDPELIRSVPLEICLAGWGKHFRTNHGVAQGRGDYELSQVTDHIDDFLSHDWKTSRFDKVLAMLWTFNCRAALVSSTLVSCLTGVLRIYANADLGNHWWPVCFGYLAYAFTLCFWQRMRSCFWKSRQVFLDRLCISQEDEVLKRQGILGLPSFLHRSQRLTILWSSEWSSRLWCVFELATFLSRDSWHHKNHMQHLQYLSKGKPIQFVPVKMGSVLLLQTLCWIALAVTHAVMLDLLSPQFVSSGESETLPQVRQQLFQFYLVTFGIFALIVALILPSFIYIGQGIIRELAELPAQLQGFRVEDVKCFCCTNHHCDPVTGEELPCDRVLVHRMLARWFGKVSDDEFAYVQRFNRLVREELSIVVGDSGATELRFSDAVQVAWSCTIPWISDFIPWWADSDLTGFSWFLWFLRGFMLWSYNGIVMLATMCVCVILWKLSLGFLDTVPRCMLTVAQVTALLGTAILVWLPFRWWYVTTDEFSLLPILPYSATVLLTIGLFRCQSCAATSSHEAVQSEQHREAVGWTPQVSPTPTSPTGPTRSFEEVFEETF